MEVAELTPVEGNPLSTPLIVIAESAPRDVRLLEEAFHERRISARLVVKSVPRLHGFLGSQPAQIVPRLIIIDYPSSVTSGLELLRALSADPRWLRVPKAVLTASESDTDRSASFAAGAVEYLVKPEALGGFLQIVDRLQAYLVSGMREKA